MISLPLFRDGVCGKHGQTTFYRTGGCVQCHKARASTPAALAAKRAYHKTPSARAAKAAAAKTPEARAKRYARKRQRMTVPEIRVSELVAVARRRGRRTGVPCDFSLTDLLPLPTHCAVLGIVIDYATYAIGRRDGPSIDRIVNGQGYVRGNVRVISLRANRLKSDGTPAELMAVALDSQK